eukprot:scaffold2769_cov156-Amphora_coffeaeformis.AAC.2
MAAIKTRAMGTTVRGLGPKSAKPAGKAKTPDPTMDLTKEILRLGTVVDPLLVVLLVLRSSFVLSSPCRPRREGDVGTEATCRSAEEEEDDDFLLLLLWLDDFFNDNCTKLVGRMVAGFTLKDENANVEEGNKVNNPTTRRRTTAIILLLLGVKTRDCGSNMLVMVKSSMGGISATITT